MLTYFFNVSSHISFLFTPSVCTRVSDSTIMCVLPGGGVLPYSGASALARQRSSIAKEIW